MLFSSWKGLLGERSRHEVEFVLFRNISWKRTKTIMKRQEVINRHQWFWSVSKTTIFAGSSKKQLFLPDHLKLKPRKTSFPQVMIRIETYKYLSCNISSAHISPAYIFHRWRKAAPLHEYLSKNEVDDEHCQNPAGCLSTSLPGDRLWRRN